MAVPIGRMMPAALVQCIKAGASGSATIRMECGNPKIEESTIKKAPVIKTVRRHTRKPPIVGSSLRAANSLSWSRSESVICKPWRLLEKTRTVRAGKARPTERTRPGRGEPECLPFPLPGRYFRKGLSSSAIHSEDFSKATLVVLPSWPFSIKATSSLLETGSDRSPGVLW